MSKKISQRKAGEEVIKEIKRTLEWMKEQNRQLDKKQLSDFVSEILKAKKIFVTGKGRSSLVGRAFAMRLVHLGYDTTVLGEDTAPPVKEGDLFFVISGGGENRVAETKTARRLGARVLVVTSYPTSRLARLSHKMLIVHGREKEGAEVPYRERRMQGLPVLPLGTSFEDLSLIVLDSIIGYIAAVKEQSEKDLDARHTTLQL